MVPKASRAARIALLRALIGDAGLDAGDYDLTVRFEGVLRVIERLDDDTIAGIEKLYRATDWLIGWDAMRVHVGLSAKQWENARPEHLLRRGHRQVFIRVLELEQWARTRALLTAAGTRQVVYGAHAGRFRDPDLEGWPAIARAAGLTVASAQRAATDYAPALATERTDGVRVGDGLPVRYRHRRPPLAHSSEIAHWRLLGPARAESDDAHADRTAFMRELREQAARVDAERDAERERALWPIRRVWDVMTILARW